MYAFLFDGLNPVLRFAVAVGASFFMLGAALLAANKFAHPLPMAPLWVLGTYYIAQILIAHNARPATSGQRAG